MMTKYLMVSVVLLTQMGCMHMGMSMGGTMMDRVVSARTKTVQEVNSGQVIDQMITKALQDLSSENMNVTSVAVWQIKSRTPGIDVVMVRQRLIEQLVSQNRYKVVSRKRLEELLEEQSLSLSGGIDKKSAVEIGQLVGVEGFIDGYIYIESDRIVLSLSLIETRTGVIVWSKTIEE